jgi:hypothetical protein
MEVLGLEDRTTEGLSEVVGAFELTTVVIIVEEGSEMVDDGKIDGVADGTNVGLSDRETDGVMVGSFASDADCRRVGVSVASMEDGTEGTWVGVFDGEMEGDYEGEMTVVRQECGKANQMGRKSVRKSVYCLERRMGLNLAYLWEHSMRSRTE